jgi:hypothetical protein
MEFRFSELRFLVSVEGGRRLLDNRRMKRCKTQLVHRIQRMKDEGSVKQILKYTLKGRRNFRSNIVRLAGL